MRIIMQWSQRRCKALDEGYERSLRWVGHRRTLLVAVVALFISSLALLPFIGTEFCRYRMKASSRSSCAHPSASG